IRCRRTSKGLAGKFGRTNPADRPSAGRFSGSLGRAKCQPAWSSELLRWRELPYHVVQEPQRGQARIVVARTSATSRTHPHDFSGSEIDDAHAETDRGLRVDAALVAPFLDASRHAVVVLRAPRPLERALVPLAIARQEMRVVVFLRWIFFERSDAVAT